MDKFKADWIKYKLLQIINGPIDSKIMLKNHGNKMEDFITEKEGKK